MFPNTSRSAWINVRTFFLANSRIRKGINLRSNGIDLPSFPGLLSFHDHSTAFLNSYPSAARSRAGLCDDRTGRRTDRARLCVENYVDSFQRRYRLRIFPLRVFSLFSSPLPPARRAKTADRHVSWPDVDQRTFPVFVSAREPIAIRATFACAGVPRLAIERIEWRACGRRSRVPRK